MPVLHHSSPTASSLPRLPDPKRPEEILDTFTLDSVDLAFPTESQSEIQLDTIISTTNPFGKLHAEFPWNLAFDVTLDQDSVSPHEPGDIRLARIITSPVILRGQTRLQIGVKVLSDLEYDPSSRDPRISQESPLSALVQNYLNGRKTPITITGSSHVPPTPKSDPVAPPPEWLAKILAGIDIHSFVPSAPQDSPPLVRSVTIQNMRIGQSKTGRMTGSGTVIAQVELPPIVADLLRKGSNGTDVPTPDVRGFKPDILVFDGLPPPGGDIDKPSQKPYPPRAFGRIHPPYWIDSTSKMSTLEPGILIVTAPIHDVEIDVLDGRDDVVAGFVGKIVANGGARAGLKGQGGVKVSVQSYDKALQVDGMPILGDFVIGRPLGAA